MVAERRVRHKGSDVGLNRTITIGEAHALMRAATCERDRLIVLVLWATGCRISEAMSLRACDVLAEESALRLRNRKQADPRAEKFVAVKPEVIAELDRYTKANGLTGTDWIFPGRDRRQHLTERQARNVVYSLASRAAVLLPRPRDGVIRPIWPHVLRHSYATHLLREDVDLLTVAEQLGHAQIANTRKYTHLVLTDRRKKLEGVRF